ncbi:MAG: DUF1501 domain-containing protein, partial [Planctomycetes bacterium]|nr:DUF1501 domain-containing protein [Planctomycetota bacterium]
MLSITSRHAMRHCDGWSRREMLRDGALGLGGLGLPELLQLQQVNAAAPPRIMSVVILSLSGGPS